MAKRLEETVPPSTFLQFMLSTWEYLDPLERLLLDDNKKDFYEKALQYAKKRDEREKADRDKENNKPL